MSRVGRTRHNTRSSFEIRCHGMQKTVAVGWGAAPAISHKEPAGTTLPGT